MSDSSYPRQDAPINWTTTTFLIATLVISVVGTPLYLAFFDLRWFDLALLGVMFVVSGMSITVGYHRLFTHRAFRASWPVRLWTLFFGAATFESSALLWCSDHRYHHKYTDQDGNPYDPHSIRRGFWWAHMGWLFRRQEPGLARNNVDDLRRDPLVAFQDRYYVAVAVTAGFLLPALLGVAYAAWSGSGLLMGLLGGLLFGGFLRIALIQQCTFLINSVCHIVGSQPFNSRDSSRDSTLIALFTFGEGYHNFHHTFQADYRNGVRPWHFDPGKWTIWTLDKLGLATDLRRVPRETIRLACIREQRRRLEERLAAAGDERESFLEVLRDLETRLEGAHLRCRVLLGEYAKIAGRHIEDRKRRMREVREELRAVRREFARLAKEWEAKHRWALSQAVIA